MTKNFSKGYDRLAGNDVRVTSCSAVFDPKKGFAGRAVRPIALQIQKNDKDIKAVDWTGLQNCYLGFLKFLDFDPQKSKNRFFEYNSQKIQKVF